MTDAEAPEAAAVVRRAFPDMGTAIYFEIAERTHGVLYELPRQRLNWLWCALSLINSSACTCNVTDAMLKCAVSSALHRASKRKQHGITCPCQGLRQLCNARSKAFMGL